ncbi:hypothetical protein Tco_0994856 [Tanacetum coccineum]
MARLARAYFLQELDSLPGSIVLKKTAEFLREIQKKDREKMLQLQIMMREMELRDRENELFMKKLKGVVPF